MIGRICKAVPTEYTYPVFLNKTGINKYIIQDYRSNFDVFLHYYDIVFRLISGLG